jgi:hypothetical protein
MFFYFQVHVAMTIAQMKHEFNSKTISQFSRPTTRCNLKSKLRFNFYKKIKLKRKNNSNTKILFQFVALLHCKQTYIGSRLKLIQHSLL